MALEVAIQKQLGNFALDVAFTLDKSERTLALLGPSGCGKSVTLGCIAGMIKPDAGRIVLDGKVLFDSAAHICLPPQERGVGYLFQQYALFPNMTVEQNVMCGTTGTKAEKREVAARYISAMRLEGLERQKPAQLSGGQQQRCALARMLAPQPHLVLLDEPFSALDGYLRWELEMELTDTLKRFGGGAIYVTHNRDEVYRMCDDVCVIDQGKSDAVVDVRAFFAAPATRAAAVISGCKNVAPAVAIDAHTLQCDEWGVRLTCEQGLSDRIKYVGVRAHELELVASDGCAGAGGAGGAAAGGDAAGAGAAAGAGGAAGAAEKSREAEAFLGGNTFTCGVERVIDDLFSTIVMLKTPGGALVRMELPKEAWERAAAAEVTVRVAPAHVMALE
jgi:molybdate transport system ATP-binding protein